MATITISGGGSIPECSRTFTSDATPEGHEQIFTELDDFIRAWETATQARDAQAEVRGGDNSSDVQDQIAGGDDS